MWMLLQASNHAAGAFVGIGAVLVIGVLLVLSIFWIWMLIDCLTSSLPPTEKLIWALVILFLHMLGALLYFFIGRPRGRGTPLTHA